MLFNGKEHTLENISKIMEGIIPNGRKITLNFAVSDYNYDKERRGLEINPDILLKYFHPDDYLIKLTPMHKTKTASFHGLKTKGDYTTYHPYKEHEKRLKQAGYDVLVFIASEYEDLGLITCGNVILSGTLPKCPYKKVEENPQK